MKTYLTLILSTFLTFLTFLNASAQTGTVNGTVLDENKKPLEYATVSLLDAQTGKLAKGGMTAEGGKYVFAQVKAGRYVVEASVIGYKKSRSEAILPIENQTVTVNPIQLVTESKALNEVKVTGTRPLIERKSDRTVLNVENSVLAAGNNALEILQRAPGVTLDKDDNISLRGKQGVTVMIDGKLTYLSAAQLAAFLRSTDGNTIAQIEIITNPSAKYDAAGNSGIINIKTKKNKVSGTNGNLSATAGYGLNHKANTSININHKSGRVNVFGNYSYTDNKYTRDFGLDRLVSYQDVTTRFDQNAVFNQNNRSNSAKVGVDIELSKKNTLGFQATTNLNHELGNNPSSTLIGTQNGRVDSTLRTQSNFDQRYRNFSLNLNDKITLDTLGRELTFDIDYSRFNNTNDARYANYYTNPAGVDTRSPLFLRSGAPSVIDIRTAKTDYTHPFSKTLKLEAGLKTSFVETDNDLRFEQLRNTEWQNDPTRSNRFVYDENVNAAYLNLNKQFKKTNITMGLRAEQTNSKGNSMTTGQVVNRHYLNFFPSLFVNHDFTDKNTLGFSYSRRIDRPNYGNLNPFLYFLDQYTYEVGNPYLNPQYTQSFELNYTYNKKYTVTLGYSHTKDAITEVIKQDDANKTTFDTQENLARQINYNVNINAPITFTKWWSSNNNVTGFYMGFKSPLLTGVLNDGQFVLQGNTTQTFKLSSVVKAEATFNYQSPLTYSIFKLSEQYSFDAGISAQFANKKATIKLAVNDIFNTRRNDSYALYQNLNFSVRQKPESRVARLTLSYNFGNAKIQQRERKGGAESEKSRVGK